MIAIGRYFLFIISLAGMTLSVESRINEDDIVKFLDDIFMLHNKYRNKHGVGPLQRTSEMDYVATQILDDMFKQQYNQYHDQFGKNYHVRSNNKNTKLNTSEAKKIFFEWYKKGRTYNFFFEPSNNDAEHFTQIVWKDTQMFGIALRWTNYNYVVQVVYFPRGNIQEQFRTNVLQRPTIANADISLTKLSRYEINEDYFEDYIFYLHNSARTEHRVPLLQRDKELDDFAYRILVKISSSTYQYNEIYGKNYSERNYDSNTILNNAEAIAIFSEWYNKGANYNYFIEPSNNKAADFTQIVWMGTQTIGISMLREERFYRILVLYNPPGNYYGQFTFNVFMTRSMEQVESSLFIERLTLEENN